MKIVWTAIAKKSYIDNIDYLIQIWNLKIAQDFILEVEKVMGLIALQPYTFESWEFDNQYKKGFIHKNISFYYKIKQDEIVVHLFWNNLQDPIKIKNILLK
jgi:plasmid stabilization system protein ParE